MSFGKLSENMILHYSRISLENAFWKVDHIRSYGALVGLPAKGGDWDFHWQDVATALKTRSQ